MMHGLPQLEVLNCFVNKQHHNPIPKKSEWRAGKILNLIHAYICRQEDNILVHVSIPKTKRGQIDDKNFDPKTEL